VSNAVGDARYADAGAPTTSLRATPRAALGWFVAVATGVLGADQFAKWLVLQHIRGGETKHVVGPVVLRRAFNTGVAFTLGDRQKWLPFLLPVIVVALTIWAVRRVRSGPRSDGLVFGLLVGGAWGNLLDRAFRGPRFLRGAVVDFVDVGVFNFAVFNVADAALTVSCFLLILMTLLRDRARSRQGSAT
jgi:signal peptidase II